MKLDPMNPEPPVTSSFISAAGDFPHLAPREVLFQKGDTGDALYGIRRGQIRIETGTASGGQLTLNFLGSGDLGNDATNVSARPSGRGSERVRSRCR
jgi:hypothetical protein